MVDANVPDIALEPDKTVKKVTCRFLRHDISKSNVAHHVVRALCEQVKITMSILLLTLIQW